MREEDIPIAEMRDCETGCGQLVIWAVYHVMRDGTEKRKPIDVKPSEAGRFTLARSTKNGKPRYATAELSKLAQRNGAIAAGQLLHTSHGITCPNRDKWLRTKGRK